MTPLARAEAHAYLKNGDNWCLAMCTRPGHSCLRRISSWAAFPHRDALRRAGRAWRATLVWMGHGAATAGMARSAIDLRERVARLQRPGATHCARCSLPRRRLAGVVLDASAMYERVAGDQVVAAAEAVLDVLRSRCYRGVVIQSSRQLRGRPVRTSGLSQCGATYVSFEVMRGLLVASLSVRFATYGDEVFIQEGGLPIGGPLSDLGAGLLLGLQESVWRQLPRLRSLGAFDLFPDAAAMDEKVAQCRYVDDIVSVSATLCVGCLEDLVRDQHPGVPFSVEEDSRHGSMRWLDMQLHTQRFPMHVAPSLPELAWVLGESPVPKTFRLPPYVGDMHVDGASLRSHVRSRLSRWRQLRLSRRELTRAITYELLLFVRSGYGPERATECWARNSADHREGELVRVVARAFRDWALDQAAMEIHDGCGSQAGAGPRIAARATAGAA